MNHSLLMLLLSLSFTVCAQRIPAEQALKNPFDSVRYSRVVAYNFGMKPDGQRCHEVLSVVEEGRLHPGAGRPGAALTHKQITDLMETLKDTSTYGSAPAACFEPRLGFVFYDSRDSIVGWINVYFECNLLDASHSLPAQRYYIYEDAPDSVVYRPGFSRKGRKKFTGLCEKLKMPYCASPSSLFD